MRGRKQKFAVQETGAVSKAIILVRVSSKDQEDGHSLDAQRDRLIRYCDKKNFDILEIFTITESSTRGDRKKFMEMLDFAKRQKGTVAIVADALDRGQRSLKDSVYLEGNIHCWQAAATDAEIILRGDLGKVDIPNPRHMEIIEKFAGPVTPASAHHPIME